MDGDIQKDVVSIIIEEILENGAESYYELYKSPPGRSPSDSLLRISESIKKLDEHEAISLIRDVIDGVIFSTLHLLDAQFKDSCIATEFKYKKFDPDSTDTDLLTLYRSQVDPGGFIVAD